MTKTADKVITVAVARDRVRLLHVAGRPTYDVRALRTWLKSDASVDVVAFFILRTHTDNVHASPDELALIPFPVDELFTKHLPSFDAVVLQDFDAAPYGLNRVWGQNTDRHDEWDPDVTWIRVQDKGLPILKNRDAMYVLTVQTHAAAAAVSTTTSSTTTTTTAP